MWEGDITDKSKAWQLHFLVDKIHDWAVKIFMTFILNRLEAWHSCLIATKMQFDAWTADEIIFIIK